MTVTSLAVDDRRRAHDFYARTFEIEAIGPEAEDGIAEPLRFDIDGTSILLIPTSSFNWALGDLEISGDGQISCLMTRTADRMSDTILRRTSCRRWRNSGETAAVDEEGLSCPSSCRCGEVPGIGATESRRVDYLKGN